MGSPYGQSGRSCTGDYIRVLRSMLYDEPCVMSALRLLQARCLQNGLDVRWSNNTPPTPAFGSHLRRYYEPFCCDAIVASLLVGFVPYRLRAEGTHMVPEVLPFGTYTWSVMRSDQRYPDSDAATDRKRKRAGSLLEYVISTSFCAAEEVHVKAYSMPDGTLTCTSPLSTLITSYNRLLQMRRSSENAEMWNSRTNIVFEERDKAMINSAAERGTGLQFTKTSAEVAMNDSMQSYETRQELTARFHRDMRDAGNLPEDTSLLFAPRNYSAKCLDKADPPGDQLQRELSFTRSVALALGLPTSVLLQGSSACGGSTTGGGNPWMEGPACTERSIHDACYPLVHMLETLLSVVYKEVYQSTNVPTFRLWVSPTMAPEQLLQLYDARLLPDPAIERIVDSNIGCCVGPDAKSATQDRHRAVNILPFKDKKDAPT